MAKVQVTQTCDERADGDQRRLALLRPGRHRADYLPPPASDNAAAVVASVAQHSTTARRDATVSSDLTNHGPFAPGRHTAPIRQFAV